MPALLLLLACSTVEDTKPADTDTDTDTDAAAISETYVYDRGVTAGNPLKGFMTSYAWGEPVSDFPSSLEFAYVPLSELMGGPSSFLFADSLEPLLEAASGRGHQLVVRPYIDYPAQPSGLPGFLAGSVSLSAYDDYGGGVSPDYEDEDLRAAMVSFIEAFGAAYDGDPRLAFVQVGLLGFWGEWHTYPYESWFPGEEVQDEVLSAYTGAFPTTHVQVRYAVADSPTMRVGFHDDSFGYSTVGDVGWFFVPQLEAAGASERWMEVPIGGELRPELQESIFEEGYQTGAYAQDYLDCVAQTRASYLLNYAAFSGAYEGGERQRAEEGALALGYELTVSAVTVVDGVATVSIESTGVAPFYYPLELVLETGDEVLAEPLSLMPGESAEVTFPVDSTPSVSAPWQVSLRSAHILSTQEIRLANAASDGQAITVR